MIDGVILDTLYEGVTSDSHFEAMLSMLAEYFRCPSAGLVYIDAGRPGASIELGYGIFDAAAQKRYREEYAVLDPAPAAMANLPVGRAATTERLLKPEELKDSRFLNEFYHPLGLREAMGGPIVKDAGRFGIIAVQRGPDRPSFDDTDISAFEVIMPHVSRVIALRRSFFELETRVRTLDEALDAIPIAVLVLNSSGVLTHGNSFARALLAQDDGLALTRDGRLEATDPVAAKKLKSTLDTSIYPIPTAIIRIPRKSGRIPYVLKVAPSDVTTDIGQGVVIHISDLSGPSGDVSKLLANALGLSGPSARLVAALVRGDELKTYADSAGISLNTAKFHLKAAFLATGASRQSELVRLASAIVRELGSIT
jgi:PAS domain-containing protein